MKKPYEIKNSESDLICPECSSINLKEDDMHVAKTGSGRLLKQYICNECGISFIPALVGERGGEGSKKIREWGTKIRTSEGMNEGKSWKEQCNDCIIIKKVVK